MLNPEHARERLKAFEIADKDKRLNERISLLPEDLRTVAFGMIGRKPDGKEFAYKTYSESCKQAFKQFEALSAEQRRPILDSLSPTLALYVETAYSRFWRLPYQTGYTRKAFRAPYSPALSFEARKAWFTSLLAITAEYEQDIR